MTMYATECVLGFDRTFQMCAIFSYSARYFVSESRLVYPKVTVFFQQ